MNKVFGFTLAIALATVSCGNGFEVTEQSLAGLYKPTANTKRVGNGEETDLYASFPPCYLDNYLQILADGNYNFIDGGTDCSPSVDHSGTWSLKSSTEMIVDGTPYTIQFDGRTLVQTISETTNGVTTTTKITMLKQ